MEAFPDLRQIKKRTYWSYHQDGLMDLCLGLVSILLGVQTATGNPLFAGLCWIPFLTVDPLKRALTAPRIGIVQHGRSKSYWAAVTGLLVSAAVVILFRLARRPEWAGPDEWRSLFFGIVFASACALGFLAAALRFGVRRYYGNAVLAAAGLSVILLRHGSQAAVLIAIGAALIVIGAAVLARFLRENPAGGKERTA